MRIRWERIMGISLLGVFIYLFFKVKPYLNRIFEDLADGYYYHSHDPMLRVIMFGLICVTIVAVAKIISNR